LRSYLKLQGNLDDPYRRTAVMAPVVSRAVKLLNEQVAAVHIQVILRQLISTFDELRELRAFAPPGQRSLVSCAQRRGRSLFEAATARGSISWIVEAASRTSERWSGGFRTQLATGGLS